MTPGSCHRASHSFEVIAMLNERRGGAPRVQFEPPLKVIMMAIDGTWARECLLVDVSESGARIAMKDSGVSTEEFFLLLSSAPCLSALQARLG
jgi:hypothetical protein